MTRITLGPHTIEISNPDRVLFPRDGITKADLAAHYRDVADVMLPHVRGRPLTLHRFPNGIGGQGFIQKSTPDYFPQYIGRVTLPKERGEVTYAVIEDAAGLVYLANQGSITLHVWPARADRPHHPDRIIFDLDPSVDDFGSVRRTARLVRDILDEAGLVPFVMTSGSKGLHVVAPLDRTAGFDDVRAFADAVAQAVMRRDPECCTTEFRKADRGGRIYLDTARNAYAQHSVAPYAVRALDGAPVATPLDWDEVSSKLNPRRYTLRNVMRRLARKHDPWADIESHARRVPEPDSLG